MINKGNNERAEHWDERTLIKNSMKTAAMDGNRVGANCSDVIKPKYAFNYNRINAFQAIMHATNKNCL